MIIFGKFGDLNKSPFTHIFNPRDQSLNETIVPEIIMRSIGWHSVCKLGMGAAYQIVARMRSRSGSHEWSS